MTRRNTTEAIGNVLFAGLYVLLIAFSVLSYGRVICAYVLYAGWIILGVGVIFLWLSSRSRNKRVTLDEKRGGKRLPVESGMYAIVRHPEFLSHLLIVAGLVCITQRLLTLTIGVLMAILLWLAMRIEEKGDIEKFGHAYVDYMKRVPRINLLRGLVRHRRRSSQ